MNLKPTTIEGLLVAETNKIGDERGSLMRLFCDKDLNFTQGIKQVNLSQTAKKGTVRGMHFQKAPALESKIVRCIEGAIYDVAVDLRKGSPTFLKHVAVELNAENNLALIIPAGFAHGFQALADNVKMIYLHSASYAPEHEDGLKYDDAKLGIKWPLTAINQSARDLGFAAIGDDFEGIKI